MADFLESLGQGLRGAGAILSSPVYEQQNREQNMMLAEMQRRRAELGRALVVGIESGAVDPNNEQVKMTLQRLGIPGAAFGPSPQAQAQTLRLKQEQEATQFWKQYMDSMGGGQTDGGMSGGLRDSTLLQAAATNPVLAERLKTIADLRKSMRPTLPSGARVNLEHYTNDSVKDFYDTGDWSKLVPKPTEAKDATPSTNAKDIDAMLQARGLKKGTPEYQSAFASEMQKVLTKKEGLTVKVGGGGGSGGAAPGGVGSHMMQDQATGQKYMVNERSGKAWELDDEGLWKQIPVTNLPEKLTKVGNIGTAGAREAVFTQRMIQAGNQAAKDLDNISKLPIKSTRGPFGAFGSVTAPSFLDAGKAALGNQMTTEEQQVYNSMSVGFQRSLAQIEAAGLMPSGTLTHQMDAVIFKPGDTNLTKLHKLAQTRQIVESGMEVILTNPRISESEKKKVGEIVDSLHKSIPFTHSDLIELSKRQQDNPKATMRDVLGKMQKGTAKYQEGQTATDPKTGKQVIFKDGQWVPKE